MGKLFEELKRRKVFRVAAVYAVVAWLLIQIAGEILPTFGAPEWANQTFIFILIAGFPIAVILAWAYQIGPQGIEIDQGTQTLPTNSQSIDRKFIYATFALVLLVAGFQVADWFLVGGGDNTATINATDNIARQIVQSGSSPDSFRLNINLGEITPQPTSNLMTEIDVSDDGRQLIYTVFENESIRIYVRDLTRLEAEPINIEISSEDGGILPTLSPSGNRIAFINGAGELATLSLTGGAVSVLSDNVAKLGIDWIDDQEIQFLDGSTLGLRSVTIDGADPTSITILNETAVEQERAFQWRDSLPDGENMLATASGFAGPSESGQIWVVNITNGDFKVLIEDGYHARYVPSGHIVFMRQNVLWAAAFDLEALQIVGEEVPVVAGIETLSTYGHAIFDFSNNGNLIYLEGNQIDSMFGISNRRFGWRDLAGNIELLDMPVVSYMGSNLSSQANFLALSATNPDGTLDIWLYNMVRSSFTRRTFTGGQWAIISNDEQTLFYQANLEIHRISTEGTGQPENLGIRGRPVQVTPDGTQLLYAENNQTFRESELFLIPLAGGSDPQPLQLVPDGSESTFTSISPDGRWVAYVSNETGEANIYVRPFPVVSPAKWEINLDDVTFLFWSGDSEALYVTQTDEVGRQNLYSIQAESDESFQYPALNLISEGLEEVFWGTYDGERFLVEFPDASNIRNETKDVSLVVVENWFEELNRLAPPEP